MKHLERILALALNLVATITTLPAANPDPPTITAQPRCRTLILEDTVTFDVVASGTAPLSYRWFRNGTDIPGATLPSLRLANVQQTDAGSYCVEVTNSSGSITSNPAILAVLFADRNRIKYVNISNTSPAAPFATWETAATAIQDALLAASDGDTVLVRRGVYIENINFMGKSVVLSSDECSDVTIIDGNQAGSVVTFSGGEGTNSMIQGFTITNGHAPRGGGVYCTNASPVIRYCAISGNSTFAGVDTDSRIPAGNGGDGGGIYGSTSSSLTIADCTVENNATGRGGNQSDYLPGGTGGRGGGIFCYSGTILRSVVSANSTGVGGTNQLRSGNGGSGGGIFCYSATIAGSAIVGNRTGDGAVLLLNGSARNRFGNGGDGGGVYCNCGTITDSQILKNMTGNGAGALYPALQDYGLGGEGGRGGGLFCVTNSVVEGCEISQNITGAGGGVLQYSGKGGDGGGIYAASGAPVFRRCAVAGNLTGNGGTNALHSAGSGGNGGGLFAATNCSPSMSFCSFTRNGTGMGGDADGARSSGDLVGGPGGKGGGVFFYAGTISNCSFNGNMTGNGGSAKGYDLMDIPFGGKGGDGAGCWIADGRIANCTIWSNALGDGGSIQPPSPGTAGLAGSGGGGWFTNRVGTNYTVNCTISGNAREGIYNAGSVYFNHCTIVSNILFGVTNVGSLGAQNTIFAGNQIDFAGLLESAGCNLIQNTNGAAITDDVTGNIYGVDPRLGPLQDNGGPTWTHALLPPSPAIDQGNSGGLPTDQRGLGRPYDVTDIPNAFDGSDIGAYEANPPFIAVQPTNTNAGQGESATFSVTAIGDSPISYQWLKGTDELPGATNSSLIIPNVQCGDQGQYYVKASNFFGYVFSATNSLEYIDHEPPAITCPANLVTNTDPGQCSRSNVTWTATAADNCSVTNLECVPPSGSSFALGTTAVWCTATDASGNANGCGFTVTVVDHEPPTITCPSNVVSTAEAGQCSAVLTYAPTATDNCDPALVITCDPPSGSRFQVGVSNVTCTATDLSGNTNRCYFPVTVIDMEPPVVVGPDDLLTNTTGGCSQVVIFPVMATDNCGLAKVSCSPPSGSAFVVGTTNVICTATDASGNSTNCSFTVTVLDREPPQIFCPYDFVVNLAAGGCASNVIFNAFALDNCEVVSLVCNPPSGSALEQGTARVVCAATDGSGNTNGCSFTVNVVAPQMVCPANIETNTEVGICSARVTFAYPMSCNCSNETVECQPPSGFDFPKGTTTVTCTVTNGARYRTQCSFTVTVHDAEAPTITCPTNVETNAEAGKCTAKINFVVEALDNCSNATVVCIPPSGVDFSKGTTNVACTATDSAGNQAHCSFTVTVNDVEPTTIACPPDLTVSADADRCSKSNVTYAVTASDNCAVSSLACVPPSGSTFGLGSTLVCCVVADASGNSNQCCFTVTVLSANPPECRMVIGPLLKLTPFVTENIVLSTNNATALVVLDGSSSSDECGTALQYAWLDQGEAIGLDPIITNIMAAGRHDIALVVTNEYGSNACTEIVKVIDGYEAVQEIVALLEQTILDRRIKRPLIVTLNDAGAAFDQGDFTSGTNHLQAFQNKLRTQLARQNPEAAQLLINAAQAVLDAFEPSDRVFAGPNVIP